MKRTLLLIVAAILALPLAAQTSPREFATGPAKWLMTSEEQKAWRDVKTDDQAIDFIDLFWARRDPTPGTPRNENRLEFESRVAYADANFKEGNLRGSLTERGRVLILLGVPKNLATQGTRTTAQAMGGQGFDPNDPTGGRQQAAKDVWEYDHETALKYNVPRIEVVFIHDYSGDRVRRDPQRTDFTMALPGAIKYYIASPNLTTVPEWASSRVKRDVVGTASEIQETVTLERKKSGQVLVDVPQVVARPAGIGQLVLLSDSMTLQPQSGTDPFASVTSLDLFPKDHDLGWATRYCTGQILDHPPTVTATLKIVAENGDSFSSDPEEFVPDSIKAAPGCYLVRGALPLAGVDPGSYKLQVSLKSADGAESYNLDRAFRIH